MAKHRTNSKVPVAQPELRQDFVTWNTEAERVQVMNRTAADSMDAYGVVSQNSARADFRGYRNFKDIDTATSVRPGFTRGDYEFFRPDEALPKDQKDAILRCMRAYERNGLIKNVIDLMGDFATQGIKLVHPNKKVEKFFRDWFKKVKGTERSERFLNYLYRCGNVIVKRQTAKITKQGVRANGAKIDALSPDVKLDKNEIPWSYKFVNPLAVETVAEELAAFVGKPIYALRLPLQLRNKIKFPKDDIEKGLIKQIPDDIRKAADRGDDYFVFDQNTISVYHYKKDDWLTWGYPLCYAILTDIMMYDKLKLTDMSACDNAISSVRLWTLGNIDAKIFPTKAGITKLSNVLTNNVGGGSIDLVWGPELKFQESSSQAYKYLGKEKYEPTLTAIYGGLGIPSTLTGATSAGLGKDYISLKTLTERLEYGRKILVSFWEQEIALVQQSMGFQLPAQIMFDRMTLSDEVAEKQLLISLADRDIISFESILERFDEIPDVERRRLQREWDARREGKLPEKASPFHKTQIAEQLTSDFVRQGVVTPGQVGLNLAPKQKGEKTLQEQRLEEKQAGKQAGDTAKPKGQPGQGRPAGKRDSQPRKQRPIKPQKAKAMQEIWAKAALDQISTIVQPAILHYFKKKNLRGLNTAEAEYFENIKFGVLCQFEPFETVDEESVAAVLDMGAEIPDEVNETYGELQGAFAENFNRVPSVEDLRQIQIMVYNQYKENEDVED